MVQILGSLTPSQETLTEFWGPSFNLAPGLGFWGLSQWMKDLTLGIKKMWKVS